MLTDVVHIPTQDGLRLPAAYFAAEPQTAIDAVILNPGTSGSFHNPPMFLLAKLLADRGFPALNLATRGRDVVWHDNASGRYFGSAYEDVVESAGDLGAALDYLVSRGHKRIAVGGHSLGGEKAVYYAAHDPAPNLAAVISLSGPRVSNSSYLASERADDYRRNVAKAEALVAAGTPDALFELDFPTTPTLRTAAGYLKKYGGEDLNFASWIDRIRVPLLRITGEKETNVSQRGVAEDMMRLAVNSPHRKAVIIPGAGHLYSDAETVQIADAIAEWLCSLPAETA